MAAIAQAEVISAAQKVLLTVDRNAADLKAAIDTINRVASIHLSLAGLAEDPADQAVFTTRRTTMISDCRASLAGIPANRMTYIRQLLTDIVAP